MAVLSEWAQSIVGSYPDPRDWEKFKKLPKRDVYQFVRVWMTEGIPYAFKETPILYDIGREALAGVLNDDPKHVSITGSARLGRSLSPDKFGKDYKRSADLDLFIVSPQLFERLKADALLFVERMRSGEAIGRNENERKYWPQNAKELPGCIDQGYIDSWRVPLVSERYPARQEVSRSLVAFEKRVNGYLDGARWFLNMSLRTYASWDRAIAQIGGSLCGTLAKRGLQIE